jgi:hypothetical protein
MAARSQHKQRAQRALTLYFFSTPKSYRLTRQLVQGASACGPECWNMAFGLLGLPTRQPESMARKA